MKTSAIIPFHPQLQSVLAAACVCSAAAIPFVVTAFAPAHAEETTTDILTNAEWRLRLDPATGALVQIAQGHDRHAINWLREAGHWERAVWQPDIRPEVARLAGPWGLVETAHTGPLIAPSKLTRLSDKGWEARPTYRIH